MVPLSNIFPFLNTHYRISWTNWTWSSYSSDLNWIRCACVCQITKNSFTWKRFSFLDRFQLSSYFEERQRAVDPLTLLITFQNYQTDKTNTASFLSLSLSLSREDSTDSGVQGSRSVYRGRYLNLTYLLGALSQFCSKLLLFYTS